MSLPISRSGCPADDDLLTIGVAIEVPEPIGPRLQRWRAEFGDPLADAIPAHVTLLPPTVVPPAGTDGIVAHLTQVARATEPFRIALEGTGSFRPVSPVIYVQLAEGEAACDALQQRVRTGPLRRELTFPYHPHVTVAHHVPEASLDLAEATLRAFRAEFEVRGLALYEHGRDGVWRLRQRFAFGSLDGTGTREDAG